MLLIYQYLIKFSISLAIVYLFYHFLLRRLTFYTSNRWYLLLYSASSFLIPLINVSSLLEKRELQSDNIVQFIAAFPSTSKVNQEVLTHSSSYFLMKEIGEWLLIIFAMGVLFMLGRLILQYFSLLKVKKNSTLLFKDNVAIFQVNKPIIPFSIGNSIFINQHLHNEEELKEIIRHEFIHVKQKHSIDILLGELLCVFNWYNPFAWMIRRAIRINLEFITDNKVLESGLDKKEYQRLLLKVIGISQFSLSTPFNFSSLKKRIAMMNKKATAKVQLLRLLLLLPVLTVILLAFRSVKNDITMQANSKYSNIIRDTIPSNVNDTIPNPPPPPPPPPSKMPPAPPPPPPPPALPKDVKSINITEKKVTVTLKNGKVEKYDLTDPSDRETFQKKYGEALDRAKEDERRSRDMMMEMKMKQEQDMSMQRQRMRESMLEDNKRRNEELMRMDKQKQEEIELLQKKFEMEAQRSDEARKLQIEKAMKDKNVDVEKLKQELEREKSREDAARERELARAITEREMQLQMTKEKLAMEAEINAQMQRQEMENKMNAENYTRELQERNMALQKEFELNSKNFSPEEKQKAIKQLETQQKQLSQVIEELKQKQQQIDKQIQGLKKNSKKAD